MDSLKKQSLVQSRLQSQKPRSTFLLSMIGLVLLGLSITSSSCSLVTERELIFADITEQSELLDGIPRVAQNELDVIVEKEDGKKELVTIKNAGSYRIVTGNTLAELLRVYKLYTTGELVPKNP